MHTSYINLYGKFQSDVIIQMPDMLVFQNNKINLFHILAAVHLNFVLKRLNHLTVRSFCCIRFHSSF